MEMIHPTMNQPMKFCMGAPKYPPNSCQNHAPEITDRGSMAKSDAVTNRAHAREFSSSRLQSIDRFNLTENRDHSQTKPIWNLFL